MDASFGTSKDKDARLRFLELQKQKLHIKKRKLALQQQIETIVEIKETIIEQQIRAHIEAYPLHTFIKESFAVLEQGREFKDNWHISIICEVLQAAVRRDMRNVIINIPRRTMKSLLSCVMFPCWVWTFSPPSRFLFTSYSAGFAGRDNKKCYDLITSEWYHRTFGHLFNITTAQQLKKLINDKGGFRVVFKIGKGTGEGGDFVIADDPNAIDEVESDLILDKTNNGWNEISRQNVTDRATAVRIIIQQRTTSNDLTGFLTEDEELRSLYSVLCLAMRFESDNPLANTPEKPLYLGKVSDHEATKNKNLTIGEPKLWVDPRHLDAPDFDNAWYRQWYQVNFIEKGLTTKGDTQLLWENYITDEIVKEEVAHLKAYGESAQFQQRPIRRGGNFFNSAHFGEVHHAALPISEGMIFARVWDKSGTDSAGDWTVGLLLARTKKRPYTFYIVNIYRKQVSYYQRMNDMKELAVSDYEQYVKPFEENEVPNEYEILIEKEGASSGVDVALIERDELSAFDVYFVNPRIKKGIRAKSAKLISEQGRIKVVKGHWNPAFYRELERFDPDKDRQTDDQIDTLAHGINKYRGTNTSGSVPMNGVI